MVLLVPDGFNKVATGQISLKCILTDHLDLGLSLSGPNLGSCVQLPLAQY